MRGHISGLPVRQLRHRHRAWVQAFGGRTFGKDDLVAIKHQVMIVDALALLDRGDARQANQILGRNQNLGITKQHFAISTFDHQKMLGRHSQEMIIAKRMGRDLNGKRAHVRHHLPFADPAQWLWAMIKRVDQIADAQALHQSRAKRCCNPCAGSKANRRAIPEMLRPGAICRAGVQIGSRVL